MKNETLRYKKLWLTIGLLMIAFVVVETLTPSPIGTGMQISDKVLHITGYFGMMGWFVQIFHNRKYQLLLAIGFISMGMMLEFVQGWGGVRQYEVTDMLANGTGVVLAWLLSLSSFRNILLKVELIILKHRSAV